MASWSWLSRSHRRRHEVTKDNPGNALCKHAVGWGTLALINAGLAQGKNRSGLLWFLVSLLCGPIRALETVPRWSWSSFVKSGESTEFFFFSAGHSLRISRPQGLKVLCR